MKVCAHGFNIYFLPALALLLFAGCQSHKKDDHSKEVSALRVHVEARADTMGTSQTVSVMRHDPVLVTVSRMPALTEANVSSAEIMDAPGGIAIRIVFDRTSALLLEQYTSSNSGKHFVIYGQWGDKISEGRWLAAPLITHRIANGVFAFTPDCSREEAGRFVFGLNNYTKKNPKESAQ
jgi:hypothetical protein